MISKKFFKDLFLVGLLLFILVGGIKAYNYLTDGFSMMKISSNLTYNEKWNSQHLSKEKSGSILPTLSQKFYYLGKGCQSYVFASEDGQYVIKFFKFQHLKISPLWQFLPLPEFLSRYLEKSKRRRADKLNKLFTGCKIAYEMVPEETGVVYIHLNKTNSLNITTTIYDKLGFAHKIDLDQYEFILQKKATPARIALKQIDHAEVLFLIDRLIQVLITRNQKGVIDRDPATIQNIGLIGDSAIILDVGQLDNADKPDRTEVWNRMNEIRQWVTRHHPELLASLEEQIDIHFSSSH